jgi:hypothetical protein
MMGWMDAFVTLLGQADIRRRASQQQRAGVAAAAASDSDSGKGV